jgi:pimeloyl-ACP methyl ester carboxylesterase
MARWLGVAAAVAALAAGFGAQAADKAEIGDWWRGYEVGPTAKTPDGRKLRYYCQGHGGPVVVLESGLGSGAWTWRTIQPDMARSTRVCSYDRAGYGASDEATGARDIDALAGDLAVVVKAVGGGRPVVLIGHSLGGPIVRQFAYRHTKQVAGVILLDPSGDDQVRRFTAAVPKFAAGQEAAYAPVKACQAAAEKGALVEGSPDYARCVGPPPPDMPADLVRYHVAYNQNPAHDRAILGELKDALSPASTAQAAAAKHPLGDIPFIVLTAGKDQANPGFSREDNAAATVVWRQMHWEMTSLSTEGRRRFAEGSGHYVHVDRPQAVLDALADVLAEVRGR